MFLVRSDAQIISSDPVKARWGENVSITCKATGYPIPQIQWLFRRQKPTTAAEETKGNTSIESTIKLVNVSAVEHGGTYFCTANNILGTSEVNVTVHGKRRSTPVTIFYKYICRQFLIDAVPLRVDGPVVVGVNSSNVMYGQSLTLGCWVYGYPLPSIQVTTVANTIFISRNDTPSNKNQIANNKTSLLMKFKIQKVTVHESGSYSCQQNLTNEQDLSQGSLTVNGKMCQHLLLQYKL